MLSPLEALIKLYGNGLPADLVVLSYSVSEQLSAPFWLRVEFATADPELDLDALLSGRCLLEMPQPGGTPTYLDGQIATASLVRVVGTKLHFQLVLRPSLWWLSLRENTRIFQDKSVVDILREVLSEAGLDGRADLELSQTYEKRSFAVQYRESTLNFLQRLCEDVGIFYYFTHSKTEHRVVFADDITKLPEPPEPLLLALGASVGPLSLPVAALLRRERLRTSSVHLRDFDVDNPVVFPQASIPAESPLEQPVFVYPGGFVKPADGSQRARALLLALRHDVEIFEGKLDVSGPTLGRVAEVSGAAQPDLNQRIRFVELQRLGVQHTEGGQVSAVQVTFRAVREDSPYMPPQRARRPRIHGVQTAVVVGDATADQSIYVDALGRIKVHFHWDRLNPADHQASCYIRVSQVSLGGSMILPRVGWEVAVAFLEGDPDQPVVLGRVYNAENMPPLALPANKASGSFSSSSSPGGAGKNELSVGDSGGSQGFAIKAQKDLNFATGYDQTETIQVDDESQVNLNVSRSVKANDDTKISGNQAITVGAHQMCTVKGSQTTSVGGNETANATANQLEKVKGKRTVTVAGNLMMLCNGERVNVTGAMERTVGALELCCTASNLSHNIGGSSSSTVGAIRMRLTGGGHAEVVLGAKAITIVGAAALVIGGSHNATCEGAVAHLVGGMVARKVKGTLTVKAPMITLAGGTGKFKGGSSEVAMNGGPITIKGGTIVIKAALIKKTAGSIKQG